MTTVQERIAAFPRRIVVDLQGMACKSRYGLVDPGEPGYQPLYGRDDWDIKDLDALVVQVHKTRAPTPEEREAALIGSLCGWHVPGADPTMYETKVTLTDAARAALQARGGDDE